MSQDYCKSDTIGGHLFEVYMLPPKASLGVLTDLGKMLGPSLGAISDGKEENIGQVIKLFFANIENPTLLSIIDKMADKTMVDGKPLKGANFDALFMGKIGLMFKWLVFALRSQYSDFLGDLAAMLGGQGQGEAVQMSKFLNT